jgi:peptide-methionine (R)-S-oxide reductase
MEKIIKTDAQWREELTPEQYDILRNHGTERAFSGPYVDEKTPGVFKCAGCGAELFPSDTKFDSGTGWPSFTDPMVADAVTLIEDKSFGMKRTEVRCAKCDGHLGHVFDDGPADAGGKRYCINGCALTHEPSDS